MTLELAKSLEAALSGSAFRDRVVSLTDGEARITSQIQQGALVELIRLLAPARVLEIGTYFGNTTRMMAEAISRYGGQLTTIDPFGGDRIPAIIESWPKVLQQVVTFHALNSMSYFAMLEASHVQTGANAPFDLVFVDGHHSFEYAFFDLMSAALYVRPGGVIVMDNMEQAGPDAAVDAFLARFKHWRFFAAKDHVLDPRLKESVPGSHGAILLAPAGIEIGQIPVKVQMYDINSTRIESLDFPLLPSDSSGVLRVSANLYSLPYDLHLTGKGLVGKVGVADLAIRAVESRAQVTFSPAVKIEPEIKEAPIHLEIELSFQPAEGSLGHPLLDPRQEVGIQGS